MAHRLSLRPRFSELDPYDHVNHAVYISWFEEGRVRALEAIGMGLDVLKQRGLQIVITELEVRYRGAVEASDEVIIVSGIEKIGRASSIWRQWAEVDGVVKVEARLKGGLTDATGRPTRAPAGFFEPFESLVLDPS